MHTTEHDQDENAQNEKWAQACRERWKIRTLYIMNREADYGPRFLLFVEPDKRGKNEATEYKNLQYDKHCIPVPNSHVFILLIKAQIVNQKE